MHQSARHQVKTTLAITGLVAGGLFLGSAGTVTANAATLPESTTSQRQVSKQANADTSIPAKHELASITSQIPPVNPAEVPVVTTDSISSPTTPPKPEPRSSVAPEAPLTPSAPTATAKKALSDWMPDANLQTLVLNALHSQNANLVNLSDITPENMAGLTEINTTAFYDDDHDIQEEVPGYRDAVLGVKKLNGLEKAINLTNLTISNSDTANDAHRGALTDISPLATLKKLQKINLAYNQITDISALKNLSQLKTVKLQDNKIVSIAALANKPLLTQVNVGHNEVVDVTPLQSMRNPEEVMVNNNHISDISPLKPINNALSSWGIPSSNQTVTLPTVEIDPETNTYTLKSPVIDINGQVVKLINNDLNDLLKTTTQNYFTQDIWSGFDKTTKHAMQATWSPNPDDDTDFFSGTLIIPFTLKTAAKAPTQPSTTHKPTISTTNGTTVPHQPATATPVPDTTPTPLSTPRQPAPADPLTTNPIVKPASSAGPTTNQVSHPANADPHRPTPPQSHPTFAKTTPTDQTTHGKITISGSSTPVTPVKYTSQLPQTSELTPKVPQLLGLTLLGSLLSLVGIKHR